MKSSGGGDEHRVAIEIFALFCLEAAEWNTASFLKVFSEICFNGLFVVQKD